MIPIECERKFLIHYPDIALLKAQTGVTVYHIEQTYLVADPDTTARVRRRTGDKGTEYFYTAKKRITAMSATEDERTLTKEEYETLLLSRDPHKNPVFKTRYVIPYEGHLLEIDVYPFWEKQAVLEIELESEDTPFAIPSYLTVLREVTADKAYKNANLARHIPKED